MNTKLSYILQRQCNRQRSQQGAVLILSLVILAAMTLIGVTAMQGTTQEERMASNARQRNIAFQAAEAGLRSGEAFARTITTSVTSEDPTLGFRETVTPSADVATYWLDIYDWSKDAYDVDEGAATVLDFDPGGILELSAPPRYVIEQMVFKGIGGLEAGKPRPARALYRITARGTGGVADAVVVLQTLYEPPPI